jgi:hypothetical protein
VRAHQPKTPLERIGKQRVTNVEAKSPTGAPDIRRFPISAEGYVALQKELEHRLKSKRAEIIQQIGVARGLDTDPTDCPELEAAQEGSRLKRGLYCRAWKSAVECGDSRAVEAVRRYGQVRCDRYAC